MLFLFTKSGQMAHVESRDRHADGDLKFMTWRVWTVILQGENQSMDFRILHTIEYYSTYLIVLIKNMVACTSTVYIVDEAWFCCRARATWHDLSKIFTCCGTAVVPQKFAVRWWLELMVDQNTRYVCFHYQGRGTPWVKIVLSPLFITIVRGHTFITFP